MREIGPVRDLRSRAYFVRVGSNRPSAD
jgi:hypothetical protein